MNTRLRQDSRDIHVKDYFPVGQLVIPDNFEFNRFLQNPIEIPGGTDCTALDIEDICVNQTGIFYDEKDFWSRVPNKTNNGTDPRDTLNTLVTDGLQPVAGGPRDTRWISYMRADGNSGDYFENTRLSMVAAQSPSMNNSYYYQEWLSVSPDEVMPQGRTIIGGHSWEVTGCRMAATGLQFHVKDWTGVPKWMPKEVYNVEMDKWGTSAFIPTTKETQGQFKKTVKQILIDLYRNLVLLLEEKLSLIQTSGFPPVLYTIAKGLLGQHLTLNDNVPPEVGCAEALSYVLKKSGYVISSSGIPGTSSLYSWLKTNTRFQVVTSWQAGDIIISPTGMGNNKIPGHVGVMGTYGIMSNDSNSGLFLELWTIEKWKQYYAGYGGLPIYYFRPL